MELHLAFCTLELSDVLLTGLPETLEFEPVHSAFDLSFSLVAVDVAVKQATEVFAGYNTL